ncbi:MULTISPECIES: ABC transporter ATP-binding protein [unclassified Oceanispirochaeta]|uniref:ABC transporter ATP-binding protein n=1 Tax=unclassified Oceanispirochaeta TaxID=2635722 RepID=UPI000E09E008|nr:MULTISPECIES: energy-coupling factor transporter ATPase [unclassified Oceanispirochaeta]MBF9014106.1 ATP-binding cassette domain-containing protein [Oceanispirochaeta sp. M2]NPD70597.1 ATP-binding cassette domain-containing protein [Oceanispirochaeta sp. M1]RDG34362.1 ATP-binding cassette domain-containing protein [Oceanispirochaeta sp. M1]
MSFIDFRDVSFTYPGQKEAALKNVSFTLEKGKHIAVIGGNASGKSTMTRLMIGLLIPDSGQVLVDGRDTSDKSLHRQIRTRAGLVFQNPSTQIVATVVREDAAFGPENLALDSSEIKDRVRDALKETSLSDLSARATHMLSAGQQQRLALAGILAMGTGCLILDEAESMLNPLGRCQLNSLLEELHTEGFTVIRITHFMDQASRADQILLLHQGRLIENSSPELFVERSDDLESWSLKPSPVQKLGAYFSADLPEVKKIFLEEDLADKLKSSCRIDNSAAPRASHKSREESPLDKDGDTERDVIIRLSSVSRSYGSKSAVTVDALRDVSFKLFRGESVSVMGTTGSGKSTFLQILNSLLLPDTGELTLLSENPLDKKTDLARLRSRIGLVMQQPEKQLFASLVGDDVAFGPYQMGLRGRELSLRVKDALDQVGLSYKGYKDFPVRALSGGQKRKAALAGVLAMKPEVLLLDEPTAGLDPLSADNMESILRSLHKDGLSLITVTHNVEQAVRLSERLLVFREGRIFWDGGISEFFQNHDPGIFGLEYPLSSRIALALGMRPLPVTPAELYARLECRV